MVREEGSGDEERGIFTVSFDTPLHPPEVSLLWTVVMLCWTAGKRVRGVGESGVRCQEKMEPLISIRQTRRAEKSNFCSRTSKHLHSSFDFSGGGETGLIAQYIELFCETSGIIKCKKRLNLFFLQSLDS